MEKAAPAEKFHVFIQVYCQTYWESGFLVENLNFR